MQVSKAGRKGVHLGLEAPELEIDPSEGEVQEALCAPLCRAGAPGSIGAVWDGAQRASGGAYAAGGRRFLIRRTSSSDRARSS